MCRSDRADGCVRMRCDTASIVSSHGNVDPSIAIVNHRSPLYPTCLAVSCRSYFDVSGWVTMMRTTTIASVSSTGSAYWLNSEWNQNMTAVVNNMGPPQRQQESYSEIWMDSSWCCCCCINKINLQRSPVPCPILPSVPAVILLTGDGVPLAHDLFLDSIIVCVPRYRCMGRRHCFRRETITYRKTS